MRRIALFLVFFLMVFSTIARADDFALATNAFLDTGSLPVLYTCDGRDLSPQLTWSNVPAKTKTFALIVSDPDAPGGEWYHWVVYDIPKSVTKFEEGVSTLPGGALAGKNSWGKARYSGPCPPKGSLHTYVFTLYALDTKLSVPAGADAKTILDLIKSHTVQQAKLTAAYSRWMN